MFERQQLMTLLTQAGTHERKIRGQFKGKTDWAGGASEFGYPLTVVAFTNRCGSNYFAELLRSTKKIDGLGEALNWDTIERRSKKTNFNSFPDYFRALNSKSDNPIGVKASWDQLLFLIRARIPEMFSGLRVLYIQRRDIIGQAISRDIAWQTNKWTSIMSIEDEITPRYDSAALTTQVLDVQKAQSIFPLIFEAFAMEVLYIYYEELVRRPEFVVREALDFIGAPDPNWNISPGKLQKQANKINDSFRSEYSDMLRTYCLGTKYIEPAVPKV